MNMIGRQLAGWTLLTVFLMTGLVWRQWPDQAVHLVMCDVGQGDAFLITQGFSQLLIDTGPAHGGVLTCLGRYVPFWDRYIETVMITHADGDHMGSIDKILSAYHVGAVITTLESKQNVANAINDRSFLTLASAGQKWQWGRVTGAVVWPLQKPNECAYMQNNELCVADHPTTDTNGTSLVMQLTVATRRESGPPVTIWMAGDAGEGVEAKLLQMKAVQPMTMLKVAHHGSNSATSEPFLSVLQPRQAWVSVGTRNRYGHPAKATLSRLEKSGVQVQRTDLQGDIAWTVY